MHTVVRSLSSAVSPTPCVPDNLKAGVTHPHRYEPDLNPTYADMAAHYGVAVLPTRHQWK